MSWVPLACRDQPGIQQLAGGGCVWGVVSLLILGALLRCLLLSIAYIRNRVWQPRSVGSPNCPSLSYQLSWQRRQAPRGDGLKVVPTELQIHTTACMQVRQLYRTYPGWSSRSSTLTTGRSRGLKLPFASLKQQIFVFPSGLRQT